MMGRRVSLGISTVALLLFACGGSTVSDDNRGGSSGTTASGGSGAKGGSGGGGTGGSSGSGGGGGFGGTGTGAQGGTGGSSADCDKLSARYGETLGVAKQCNPFIDFEQCTVLVQSDLFCGCPTFVSSGQQVAVAELGSLQADWQKLGCGGDILCEPCAMPQTGFCQVSGNSGSCIDIF